jgi:hypothetical protein
MNPIFAARQSTRATAPTRAPSIERQLSRFPDALGQRVRALAAEHPALADLAVAFPALLFALATARDGAIARRGVEAVVAGRKLREIAAIVEVPMWMRDLPPETFAHPLAPPPTGALFTRRIGNHLPKSPKSAADWLAAVSTACLQGDEMLAVWVAREYARLYGVKPRPRPHRNRNRKPSKTATLQQLPLVCLWAWFSQRPEAEASTFTQRRWTPEIRYETALSEARDWMENIETLCWLAEARIDDVWFAPAAVDGFEFIAIATARDLITEAAGMRNCLRSYAAELRSGRSRFWSVRRNGRRVATLHFRCVWGCERLIGFEEGHARLNRGVSSEAQSAISAWLAAQTWPTPAPPNDEALILDAAVWRRLMRPYWIAKRGALSWLPLKPGDRTLWELRWR